MRYSKKLRKEISMIIDPNKLREKLVYVYVNSTCLEDCSKLFDCDIKFIIKTLKEEGVFEHKYCSKCGVLKPFTEFYSNPSMGKSINRCGVSSQCRDCVSKNGKRYFQENREKKYEYGDWYRQQDTFKDYKKQYDKDYKSREDIKRREALRANIKYHTEPKFHLKTIMSVQIRGCLKDGKNGASTEAILGYTITELKAHLEAQFDDKMTWQNHGDYWEIDHILPIDYFNFTSYDDLQFKQCWALENLQPLEKIANRRKSNKID
jgi:hypothetical protein